jgi:tRNA A37 threonylcarbamoyltransferase TsaD
VAMKISLVTIRNPYHSKNAVTVSYSSIRKHVCFFQPQRLKRNHCTAQVKKKSVALSFQNTAEYMIINMIFKHYMIS